MKQRCIILRSGSEFWISEDTAKKIEDQLVNQTKHNFLKITEINRTINTADIVEICTIEQMEERNHLKNKDWQCTHMKWHTQKEKCYCASEKAKQKRDEERRKEMDDMNKPLTKEEEEHRKKMFADTRKFLEDKGILANRMKI